MTVFSSSAAVAYHDGLLSRASSAPPASRFDGEEISKRHAGDLAQAESVVRTQSSPVPSRGMRYTWGWTAVWQAMPP